MKILGISDDYYEVLFGIGRWGSKKGPFYNEADADQTAYLLMTENIKEPMKNRIWLNVKKNDQIFKTYRRLEEDVWKELPVG